IEELAGPGRRVVIPKLLKSFLEKVRVDGSQVVAEEIPEAEVLLIAEVLAAFEQQPTGLLQDRVAAFAFHAAGFLRANFVECLVHVCDDVETMSSPMAVKNPWNDSIVRSLPTQSRRVMPISIW